jgi:xylulokinase
VSLCIGLDVGTQSVKLVAYDPEVRQVVATHGRPLDLIVGDDGSREQRAEWWTTAIQSCFAALEPAQRARVAAIGVSGQQHGFVPLGDGGAVLAPAKLWCDTSTQIECDEIMHAIGDARRCVKLAGNPILAGYTASKLPWTRKHRPDVYARLETILLPHDYVDFWLTGERWMEHGDASGTGWLDVRGRRWSREMLAATDPDCDLSALLPPLVASQRKLADRAGNCRPARTSAQRSRQRRWRRQHDGGNRHGQRRAGNAEHEPRARPALCSRSPTGLSWTRPAAGPRSARRPAGGCR